MNFKYFYGCFYDAEFRVWFLAAILGGLFVFLMLFRSWRKRHHIRLNITKPLIWS